MYFFHTILDRARRRAKPHQSVDDRLADLIERADLLEVWRFLARGAAVTGAIVLVVLVAASRFENPDVLIAAGLGFIVASLASRAITMRLETTRRKMVEVLSQTRRC